MISNIISRLALAAVLCAASAETAVAGSGNTIAGPIEARVIRILDGDTFLAEAKIWPGQTVRVNVRIRGIDAPEKRSKCAAERHAAARASEMLAALLKRGTVMISNVGGGKYYGRVLADVNAGDIRSVAAVMLHHSLVRPYYGGKRKSRCS